MLRQEFGPSIPPGTALRRASVLGLSSCSWHSHLSTTGHRQGVGEPPATYGGASFPVVTPPCQVAGAVVPLPGDRSSCHRDSGPLYRVQAHRPALLSVVRGPSSRSPPTSVDKAGLCLCLVRCRSLAGVLSELGSSRALGMHP